MPRGLTTDRLDQIEINAQRRGLSADLARTVADRSEKCLPSDRSLLRAIFRDGLRPSEVARLRGVTSNTIRRRIQMLVKRVLSPEFVFVMRHYKDWEPTRRRVGVAHFLEGRTLRSTAKKLRISLHTVRCTVVEIRAMCHAELDRAA